MSNATHAMKRLRRLTLIPLIAFGFLSILATGGGGGGGDGAAPPPSVTVAGSVQAPNGQVVMNGGTLQRWLDYLVSSAVAQLTGISPVPDGTQVELVRIDDTGTVTEILATTTTSGGRYSFDLTALGLSFASDLVVRVLGGGGVEMRAFVTGGTVDMNPETEAAVGLILDHIQANPGTALSDFTLEELADFADAVDLISRVQQLSAGPDIPSTVTTIENTVTADADIMAFLNAAAQPGQTSEGPGDIGNYFPFNQGLTSTFSGTISGDCGPATSYTNVLRIMGTRDVDGTTTTVFSEDNTLGAGPLELLLVKTGRAITDYSLVDEGLTQTPTDIVLFPLSEGRTFAGFSANGLDFGVDLDGDFVNETFNTSAEIKVAAFEDVMTPAGTFVDAVRIQTTLALTVFLSRGGTATTSQTLNEWYAQGAGLIKRQSQLQIQVESQSCTESITEELTSSGQAIELSLAVNDLVYDANSQRLYASVPSSDSIAIINPNTGQIDLSVPIGSEPGPLAISDDGQFLYIGLNGTATVRQFVIASQTPGLEFPLGSDSFFGAFLAEDIEVLPGDTSAIAVSRKYSGTSPRHAGVGIYDNGVPRANATADHTGSNVIEFGSAAATLYGYNNETTEFGFRRMSVDNQGVAVDDVTGNLISGFGVGIKHEAGRIYATSGRVIDPVSLTIVGTLASSGPVEPDSGAGRVFVLTGSGTTRALEAYDINSLQFIGSGDISGVNGTPRSLIRWGQDGFAFHTTQGEVIIFQTTLISSSSSSTSASSLPENRATTLDASSSVSLTERSVSGKIRRFLRRF